MASWLGKYSKVYHQSLQKVGNLSLERTGWLRTYDPAINQDKNMPLVIPIKFINYIPKYAMIKGKNPALPSVEAVLVSEWSTDYHFRKKARAFKRKIRGNKEGT